MVNGGKDEHAVQAQAESLTVGLYFEKPTGSFRGRESRLFMAGMATPLPTPTHTCLLF